MVHARPIGSEPDDTHRSTRRCPISDSEATIYSFYEAFAARNFEAMAACYHPDIHFSDPVFPDLHGDEVAAMWHMLCEQGLDLRVTVSDIEADGDIGSAHWEAYYTFTPTSRLVHNKVDANFEFTDGKIVRHVDTFDLWRWLRQAVGMSGLFIGWTSTAQEKVQESAGKNLDRFLDDHPEYERAQRSDND